MRCLITMEVTQLNVYSVRDLSFIKLILVNMKLQFLFISYVFLYAVAMKDECRDHYKCLSDFLKEFIASYHKFDIVVKETKYNDNKAPKTLTKTIEISSNNINNFIRQLLTLFNLEVEDHIVGAAHLKKDSGNRVTLHVSEITTESYEFKKDIDAVTSIQSLVKHTNEHKRPKQNRHHKKPESKLRQNTTGYEVDDYYDDSTNSSDYPAVDYIDFYKDTTNEPIRKVDLPIDMAYLKKSKYEHTDLRCQNNECNLTSDNDIKSTVFPWIATIFLKNGTSDQFDYYCDGVLLNEKALLTSAQCVNINSTTVNADHVIIILGKRSLLTMGDKEKVLKINKIKVHPEYKRNGKEAENDLALLELEHRVEFDKSVMPACLLNEDRLEDFIEENLDIVTTGWAISGELSVVPFDKQKSKDCDSDAHSENIFCANYNNDVTVCPSYGSLFVTRSPEDNWCVRGLRTGDPSKKGFCYNNGVFYTDLLPYMNWIVTQQ